MRISVFGEGPTEEKVHNKLAELINLSSDSKYFASGGKRDLNKKFITTIGADLGVRLVRCLIFRDLDEGENQNSICQSITDALRRELEERSIFISSLNPNPHPIYSHLYTLNIAEIDFCLAIHIATYKWNSSFKNATIDDYLLKLALKPNTVANLSTKFNSYNDESRISSKQLSAKIIDELPEILQTNGITLREAKNYLQIYAATIQFSSLTGFISKMIENANEPDIREVFQAAIAAFEFVGDS